jgi:hypothetical protein
MCIGIYFMLRKSEHLESKLGTAQPLLRSNMMFFDKEGRIIPYAAIGDPSRVAHKVFLTVNFSKTDSSGYGRRLSHIRQYDPVGGFCIVRQLEEWIRKTRVDFGTPYHHELYGVQGVPKLKAATVVSEMRAVVEGLGISTMLNRTSSHSLRYGGATMMAAAGFPQYIIAQYGGWTAESQSLKLYTKLPDLIIDTVSAHMSKMANTKISEAFASDTLALVESFGNNKKK